MFSYSNRFYFILALSKGLSLIHSATQCYLYTTIEIYIFSFFILHYTKTVKQKTKNIGNKM